MVAFEIEGSDTLMVSSSTKKGIYDYFAYKRHNKFSML